MSRESLVLSLLITTHNRRDELVRTLRAMVPAFGPGTEILVLDDGSSDGTAQAVADAFPEVTLIRREVSGGYISARNHLLSLARGAYALTLDDDAEIVTAGAADAIREYLSAHPACAVMAPAVHWGLSRPSTAATTLGTELRVRSFVGCGHVWRMSAWREIPAYPEWFEFYGEEDFAAYHLLRRGWEVHYVPSLVVHHRVSLAARSADQQAWRYRRQLRAGLLLMLLFYPLRALPRRLTYVLWAQIRRRVLGQRDHSAARSLAWVVVQVAKNLPRIIRHRTPLTSGEWGRWNALSGAVIFAPSTSDSVPTK